MRRRQRVVAEHLPIRGLAPLIRSGIPGSLAFLAVNRPVRQHKILVLHADPALRNRRDRNAPSARSSGRRRRRGSCRRIRRWIGRRRSRNRRQWARLMVPASCGTQQRQAHPRPARNSTRAPWPGIYHQLRGPFGWLCAFSARSARLRNVSDSLRIAEMDSFRTCGITASFTYPTA